MNGHWKAYDYCYYFTEFYRILPNFTKNHWKFEKFGRHWKFEKFGFWNFMNKTIYRNLPGPTGNSVNPEITT